LEYSGLALRGHDENEDAKNRGNFLELFEFASRYNPSIMSQSSQTCNYKSNVTQNEIIEIVAKEIVSTVLPPQCAYFSIIADETTDTSRREQVCIVIRYIDNKLTIYEKFVGFFDTDSTNATALCKLILKVLEDLGLDYKTKMVGQCYDGARNMSGCKNGLHMKIREVADKALYVHCYAHQLNLALQHSCNNIPKARNCLNTLNSLHEFIEGSAKRHSLFESIQCKELRAKVLQHLSDTRWASRDLALNALKDTYTYVIEFLRVFKIFIYFQLALPNIKFNLTFKAVDEGEKNSTGAKVQGLLIQVLQFDFLFYVHVLCMVFNDTSILNRALQSRTLDISTALESAGLTIEGLVEKKLDSTVFDELIMTIEELHKKMTFKCHRQQINEAENVQGPLWKKSRSIATEVTSLRSLTCSSKN